MRRFFSLAVLLLGPSLWAEVPIDLDSPFEKAVLIKSQTGETEKKIVKKIRLIEKNYEGVTQEGSLCVVAQDTVAAILPVCPTGIQGVDSQSVRSAIQFLEKVPEELRKQAEITPKVMVLWDELLKSVLASEIQLAQEERKKSEAQADQTRVKLSLEKEKWLEEARDFLKPRSEEEINALKGEGENLLAHNSNDMSEVEEYLAVLSQVLPREKGGPLPDSARQNTSEPEILPDEILFWLAGAVYVVSMFLLLFGLSYLSNIFTCLQSRLWLKCALYSLVTPFFFVGLYYLWWPVAAPGEKINPKKTDKTEMLNLHIRNRLKPVYYFPKKEYRFSPEEVISGVLERLTPADKAVGYLRGRMGAGELTCNDRRWAWRQGISVLGLPFEVSFLFEGALPEPENWESPRIDQVVLGRIKLPEVLANIARESMLSTFHTALQVAALQGITFRSMDGGLLSVVIPSSGTRPAGHVRGEEKSEAAKKVIPKTLKKEIAAEDLAKDIESYQGRFVLLDGYVADHPNGVDSGGEFSGDSKTFDGIGSKVLGDKPNGQIGLDRYDRFYLKGGITCIIKSKGVFTQDAKSDIYWGPRANYIQGEPLIKKGMRVRFLTEGRVEGKTVYGIRLDEPSQLSCYDPQQVIEFRSLKNVMLGDSDFDLDAKATSNLPVSFDSSDPSVAEIYKGNRVKLKKPGKTVITATQAGNSSWLSAAASQTLTVEPSK